MGLKRTIIQSYYIQTRNWRNGRTNFCTSLMVISQFGMSTHSLLGNINASKKLLEFQYMQLISRVNVILDDANSYSIAMNGLLSMAKGKIVMGGAESEGNKELGIDGVNPVFNLTRDVIQICNQIEYIILHKDKIEEWGRSSRIFVEKYHDSEMIAQQYINVFQKGLDCKNCNQLFL